jgi:type II secretory pathway pseudopilin PulG
MTRRDIRRCLAFTLVELLVVLALLLALTSMAVVILPRLGDGQNTTRAATQLQQWFEIAKQNAAKNRKPYGIRLIADPANPTYVSNLVYLEQPDSYNLGQLQDASTNNILMPSTALVAGTTVTFKYASKTLTGGFAAAPLYPVQPGDYIELGGALYKIANVDGPLNLSLNTPAPVLTTSNYKIICQPRPASDDPLDMAKNIVIDLTPRLIGGGVWDLPIPTANSPLDIMFAPDGRVLGPLAGRDKLIFWVRDKTLPGAKGDPVADGDPTLVVIYPRTGLIAAFAVDTTNLTTNPYTFTITGKRNSD